MTLFFFSYVNKNSLVWYNILCNCIQNIIKVAAIYEKVF